MRRFAFLSVAVAFTSAVLFSNAAQAEAEPLIGFQPPPPGTLTTYQVEGSYIDKTQGEERLSLPLKATIDLIAFGDDRSPQYALVVREGYDSPFFRDEALTLLTTRNGVVTPETGFAAHFGYQLIGLVLFPHRLSAEDLENHHQEIDVGHFLGLESTKMTCAVTTESKDDVIHIDRRKIDEETDDAQLEEKPVTSGRPRATIIAWQEKVLLEKNSGRLASGSLAYKLVLSFADERRELGIQVSATAGESRRLPEDQLRLISQDVERLRSISDPQRLTGIDPESLKHNLEAVRKSLDELDGFSQDRKDSPLLLAVPILRQNLKQREAYYETRLREIELVEQMKGKPTPDFTLKNLNGEDLTLSEFIRGKVAMINFWGYG